MLPDLFAGTTVPVLEQVVGFTQSRHAVLAGNIANLDTPGYRTRDFNVGQFQARLREAIERRDARPGPESLGDTSRLRGDPFGEVQRGLEGILRHDDANVGIDQQVTEVAKNQSSHNLALALMTSQFRLLQAAINERV